MKLYENKNREIIIKLIKSRKEVDFMQEFEVYSEKLGAMVKVSENISEDEMQIIMEDSNASLVGWSHGGWNNDNGGANW